MSVQTTGVLGANVLAASSTQDFPLGTRINYTDNQVYVYCQDSGSALTANQFVGIDENFSAGALTTAMADDGWFIGIAPLAVTASYYFWACVQGSNISGNVVASTPADAGNSYLLYTSATAGALGDTATAGTKIEGALNVASAGTSTSAVEFILNNPHAVG